MRTWTTGEWLSECSFERAAAHHRRVGVDNAKPSWRIFRPLVHRDWQRVRDWAGEVIAQNERAETAALHAVEFLGPHATFELHHDMQPAWLIRPDYARNYWLHREG